MDKKISNGLIHKMPSDFKEKILKNNLREIWEDITDLARNEWICWIISAKKAETRERRIRIACENLNAGKRRPCCWAGCPHR